MSVSIFFPSSIEYIFTKYLSLPYSTISPICSCISSDLFSIPQLIDIYRNTDLDLINTQLYLNINTNNTIEMIANVLKKDKYKNIQFDLILKSSRGVIGKTGQDGLVKHQENYDEKLPTNTLLLVTFDLINEYEDFINPPKKGEKGSKKGDTMYHQRINNSLTTNLYIEPLDPRVEPE